MAVAAITTTPAEVQVGDTVDIDGTGFLPSTKITLSIVEHGETLETNSDASGEFNSQVIPAKAVGTLTSDGTNVTAADTVVVGSVTYTFRASVGVTANEVLIGANASATLDNLKSAINADGNTAVYGSATVVNPTVGAGAKTATTIVLFAKTGGTGGNALATTETSTHLSFGAATLGGGAAATGNNPLLFVPTGNVPFTVQATDGTNTATKTVRVFSE